MLTAGAVLLTNWRPASANSQQLNIYTLVNPVSDFSLYQENTLKGYYYDELDLIREEILKYPWNAQIAWNVLMAESGGMPNAVNWEDNHKTCRASYGLFQMACLYGTPEELLNPKINIQKAYELQKKGGWGHWSVCKNGMVKCDD